MRFAQPSSSGPDGSNLNETVGQLQMSRSGYGRSLSAESCQEFAILDRARCQESRSDRKRLSDQDLSCGRVNDSSVNDSKHRSAVPFHRYLKERIAIATPSKRVACFLNRFQLKSPTCRQGLPAPTNADSGRDPRNVMKRVPRPSPRDLKSSLPPTQNVDAPQLVIVDVSEVQEPRHFSRKEIPGLRPAVVLDPLGRSDVSMTVHAVRQNNFLKILKLTGNSMILRIARESKEVLWRGCLRLRARHV